MHTAIICMIAILLACDIQETLHYNAAEYTLINLNVDSNSRRVSYCTTDSYSTANLCSNFNQSINLLKAKGPNGRLHRSKIHGIQ